MHTTLSPLRINQVFSTTRSMENALQQSLLTKKRMVVLIRSGCWVGGGSNQENQLMEENRHSITFKLNDKCEEGAGGGGSPVMMIDAP